MTIPGRSLRRRRRQKTSLPTFSVRSRPGGAQVFPGFRPDNELDEFRNSVVAYTDIEVNITENWLLTGAVRLRITAILAPQSISDFYPI